CVLSACFATHLLAQDPNWEQNWDPGIRDKWFQDDKTDPKKPTHRLAPVCKECQGLADQLQNALDDWYALQYVEGEAIRKDGLKKQDGDIQKAGNACKDNAIAGLGQPNAKELKVKQEKQKKDAKDDPKKFGDKKALAAEIARLKKLLDDCLEDCKKAKDVTPTPTPTTTPETSTEGTTPPVFDFSVRPLPPCFDSQRDRQKRREELEELQKKLTGLKKLYGDELAQPTGAWKDFAEKLKKALEEVSGQLGKVDTVTVPCPTPTPTPRGGGSAKTPTPTPKGKPKKAPRVTTGGKVSYERPMEDFCTEISDNKIKVDITGTGETSDHI